MSPNDLGSFLVLESCRKIQLKEVLRTVKSNIKLALTRAIIEAEGQDIPISVTDTNFAGKRMWFVCPKCGTRRSTLYKEPVSGLIQCRKCLGISYRQQRYKGMG